MPTIDSELNDDRAHAAIVKPSFTAQQVANQIARDVLDNNVPGWIPALGRQFR